VYHEACWPPDAPEGSFRVSAEGLPLLIPPVEVSAMMLRTIHAYLRMACIVEARSRYEPSWCKGRF